ncbi:uncharacterized protein F5891DRAFT_939464 [Suillus fuscotomentosus]|uniref:Uncharacterized protein n=1 Tax=Suillus fuscotomentosus TaxID=1912939 RepID=A0AAD4EK91_9AGAM|nr:uncharacterized protein F5891DRAFT_939464 [Suillus fuscotomentosus]KAG1907748.1 hypothetical protein F5891DRAFT_939464 [Suillus fuscotomentosus]
MVGHLQPLSLVINIAQATHCHLNKVLIIFSFLISKYIVQQGKASSAIINSLEKHWSKCNQDVFLAAVVLNSFYKIKPFACLCKFTNAGLMTLFVKLWG